MGGRRARFDFERVDVFGVALDAVAILDELAEVMGFRRFSMRGMDRAKGEWALICTCHNVRKLWAARQADRLGIA